MTTATISDLALQDYVGLDRLTGGTISGVDHLLQSQTVLLTTPIGTRVMRRAFGCDLPIDKPQTAGLLADVVAAAAEAIDAWEPRETLQRVVVQELDAGGFDLDLVVEINGSPLTLEGVL